MKSTDAEGTDDIKDEIDDDDEEGVGTSGNRWEEKV